MRSLFNYLSGKYDYLQVLTNKLIHQSTNKLVNGLTSLHEPQKTFPLA